MSVIEIEGKSYTIYGGGPVFILTNHHDGITEREAFVLADCYEEGKVFQIVQITG